MNPEKFLDFLGVNLTDRQRDVIELAAAGYESREICHKLDMGMGELMKIKIALKEAEGHRGLNVSEFSRQNQKVAKFRQIVNNAMLHGGLDDIDQRAEFIHWAIGDDYAKLPPQDWPQRISERARLLDINSFTSVYLVISAAVQVFKQKKIIVGMN